MSKVVSNYIFNVGVIGMGQRGYGYVRYLNRYIVENINVIGYYDVRSVQNNRVLLQRLIKFRSLSDLLNNTQINTLFICTHVQDRLQILEKILKTCKKYTILLEKPICYSMCNLRKIIQFKNNTSSTIHIPLIIRFTKLLKKFKQHIKHHISDLASLDYTLNINNNHSSSYFRRQHVEGFLMHKVCHDLDIIEFVTQDYIYDIKMGTVTRHPIEISGKKSGNCKSCQLYDTCDYRFDFKKSNYVVIPDIEDVGANHDICIYNTPKLPSHYNLNIKMKNNKKMKVVFKINLFSKKSNRTIQIGFKRSKDIYTFDYFNKTIKKNNNVIFKDNTKLSIGHQNGDVNFIKEMMANSLINKDTLFKRSIHLSKCIFNITNL